MAGFGKVIAQRDNRVTVDPGEPDAYGIPIPVIHFRWGANDLAVWKDMREKAGEMMHAAKATMVSHDGAPNGFASHETGTARMGIDPRSSVLNPH